MKTLVVYSSLSGNTKLVAEAVADVLPSCTLVPVENAPSDVSEFDLVGVGYWVAKGAPDVKTRAWLKGVTNARLALFGTLGALPESPHARDCMAEAETLVLEPERGNTLYGSWMCQGKIDPRVVDVMKKLNLEVHQDLLRDPSCIEAASHHPDEHDLRAVQDFFRGILAGSSA